MSTRDVMIFGANRERNSARGHGYGWNPARVIGAVIKSPSRKLGRRYFEKATPPGNERKPR